MNGDFSVVIRGGRVVDPAQGIDAALDVAIEDGVVAAVGTNLRGRAVLQAEGCVVAPGFIDLHSHAQSVGGHRLQAFDGVTTTLELEAGAIPVAAAYARAAAEGRPLNFGYSASWAAARIQVLAGHRGDGRATTMLSHFANPAWQREATAAEEDRIVGLLETELAGGGLGIGVLVGYAPGTSPAEYLRGGASRRVEPGADLHPCAGSRRLRAHRRAWTAPRSWCAPPPRRAPTCTTAT